MIGKTTNDLMWNELLRCTSMTIRLQQGFRAGMERITMQYALRRLRDRPSRVSTVRVLHYSLIVRYESLGPSLWVGPFHGLHI